MTELENPSFVIQVDRNDLDDQLHDQFVLARSLVGDVKQACSVEDLRDLLKTEGGEVIFTTIEKFRLNKEEGEIEHPVLSPRSNIIIIADEAHRTQYGFMDGYARYLAEALPNARRIGFTGTPISFSGADTVGGVRRSNSHLRHSPVPGGRGHKADLLRSATGQASPLEGGH